MKISRNFYLQVGCKYTYFTFTSLSIYPEKEEEMSFRSGQCLKSVKRWLKNLSPIPKQPPVAVLA